MKAVAVLVVFILCYQVYTISGLAFNFTWTNTNVYGQNDFSSSVVSTLSGPEDFVILPNGSILVISTCLSGIGPRGLVLFDPISNNNLNQYFNQNYKYYNSSTTYYGSAVVIDSTKLLIGGEYGLYFSLAFNLNISIPFNISSIRYFTGLYYWSSHNAVYMTSTGYNKVMLYNLSPNNLTLDREWGSTENPSNRTFNTPRKIIMDPEEGFWVADSNNNRVLHFNKSAGDANIVLGQPSFNMGNKGTGSASTFDEPIALALSKDGNVLFVGDNGRVLRFRAPFDNGQAAEGVLGFDNFEYSSNKSISASTFKRVFTLHLEELGNGQARLYVLDGDNNRLLSGITTLTTSGDFPLSCLAATVKNNGTCQTTEGIHLWHEQELSFPQTQLNITGDLILGNSTKVTQQAGQTIIVSGSVQFSGVYHVIVPQNGYTNGMTYTLMRFNSSSSAFSTVEITVEGSGEQIACSEVEYGEHSLVVVMGGGCKTVGSSEANNKKIIAGVVVGVGGIVMLCLIGAAVFALVFYLIRKKKTDTSTTGL